MTRYMRKGISKVRFAPTIASIAAPTTAEVTAGTDLTPQLADIAGFTFANNPIPTPDMATTFTSQVGGEDTAEASSLTFYEDDTTNPIMTTLAKGTTGYVLLYPKTAGATPASGDKLEVWPVTVTSQAREWSTGNDPARFVVSFAVTSVPNQNATQAA